MNLTRQTKALSLTLVVLLLTTTVALASPLKSPKRVVNQQTVDLTPLFQWWTNRSGARPFTAWVHLTGTVIGTNAYGWVLEAQVESSAKAGEEETGAAKAGGVRKILLRHPPLQDRANFERLAVQYKALNDQRVQATQAENQAHRYLHPGTNGVRTVESKAQLWDIGQMRATEKRAAAQKQAVEQQLKDTKAKLAAWPNTDHYEADCFALQTGTEVNRLPVYEHGMSWP